MEANFNLTGDLYKDLGIDVKGRNPADISKVELQKAWRKIMNSSHTDKLAGLPDAERALREEAARRANYARDILQNAGEKTRFDEFLKVHPEKVGVSSVEHAAEEAAKAAMRSARGAAGARAAGAGAAGAGAAGAGAAGAGAAGAGAAGAGAAGAGGGARAAAAAMGARAASLSAAVAPVLGAVGAVGAAVPDAITANEKFNEGDTRGGNIAAAQAAGVGVGSWAGGARAGAMIGSKAPGIWKFAGIAAGAVVGGLVGRFVLGGAADLATQPNADAVVAANPVTAAQLDAVESTFNKFAEANHTFKNAYKQLLPTLQGTEKLELDTYLLAVKTGDSGRKKYADSKVATDPKYAGVVAAAHADLAAERDFRKARGAIAGNTEEQTNNYIRQVKEISAGGEVATTATVIHSTGITLDRLIAGARVAAQSPSTGAPTQEEPVAPAAPLSDEDKKRKDAAKKFDEAYAKQEARKAANGHPAAPAPPAAPLSDEDKKRKDAAKKFDEAYAKQEARKAANGHPPAPSAPATSDGDYKIVRGDTLGAIAKKMIKDGSLTRPEGIKDDHSFEMALALVIAKKNGIEDFDKIYADKTLKLPNADEIKNGIASMSAATGILSGDHHISYSGEMKGHKTSDLVGNLSAPPAPAAAPAAAPPTR